MANYSWLVVCFLFLVGSNTVPLDAANVPLKTATSSAGSGANPAEPKNDPSSSMYFHQLFSKESAGSSETKLGAGQKTKPVAATAQGKPVLSSASTVVNHPTSIQAVNKTVNGGNLTSSETQQYYGYEPTGINKRHVHYPPVPMDVINSDEGQDGDGDDYDNDDGDDADTDYDGESGEPNSEEQSSPQQGGDGDDGEVTERYNDERAQKIIDEIDGDISNQERDDRDDDFDHSASFTIPKIDPNHKGCKTVYKEIQTVPGKVKTADDDFDADFAFKRRRKRSAEPKSATSSSFVIARECHFTDEENARKKLASPLPPAAAAVPASIGTVPTSSPMPLPKGQAVGTSVTTKPTIGPIPESAKPKVTTGESRFVPINADPWRSPRGPRGIGAYGRRGKNGLHYDYKVSMTPYMAADEATMKNAQQLFGGDSANTRHFHQYPYPHYHIYYNRRGTSVLNENQNGPKSHANSAPQTGSGSSSQADPEQNTYDSPNSYFEFTNPNGGEEQNQDEDEDDSNGEGADNEDQGDEGDGLAASPPEGRAPRNRRGLPPKGRYPSSPSLPLPPTLSPSRSRAGVSNDDGEYGWAVSGPNFYKSGKYNGGGKKKPKKYSYNYFRLDDPKKSEDSDMQDSPPNHHSHHRHQEQQQQWRAPGKKSPQQRPVISGSTEIHHSPPQTRNVQPHSQHMPANRSKKRSLANDDGNDDYSIHYGSGNNEEYANEYDSDKDKRNKNKHNDDGHGGGGGGGYDGGHYHDGQDDGHEEDDDY